MGCDRVRWMELGGGSCVGSTLSAAVVSPAGSPQPGACAFSSWDADMRGKVSR